MAPTMADASDDRADEPALEPQTDDSGNPPEPDTGSEAGGDGSYQVTVALVVGAVLVAVDTGTTSRTPSGRVVLGALVLEGRTIEALAVRPRRRGQGIGSALVRAADDRTSRPLRASFDADLRPFYERLGFAVEATETGRCHGRRDGEKED